MVNNSNQNTNVVKKVISDAELSTLITLSGITAKKHSPLTQISAVPSSDINSATVSLQQAGLIDNNRRPAPEFLEALTILAGPDTEIDLVWGNPDGVSLSRVFSIAGKDRLVSYTRGSGSNHLAYFLSTQDITGLVIEKTASPEIKKEVELYIEGSENVIPAFLALLDIYREAQLKAALERRTEPTLTATVDEVTRLLETSKMEPNFNWYASTGFRVLPEGLTGGTAAVECFNSLQRQGLIGSDGRLNDGLASFASRAFPLVSFVSARAVTCNTNYMEKSQFALFRGLSTLLLVQLSSENGEKQVTINSISTSRLPELLFNLATRPFEVVTPPAPAIPPQGAPAANIICTKCNTPNTPGTKFCSKCGLPMTAPVKANFCPRCGDPITTGEKFCDKCGNKLN